jgi:hypothetical protein
MHKERGDVEDKNRAEEKESDGTSQIWKEQGKSKV